MKIREISQHQKMNHKQYTALQVPSFSVALTQESTAGIKITTVTRLVYYNNPFYPRLQHCICFLSFLRNKTEFLGRTIPDCIVAGNLVKLCKLCLFILSIYSDSLNSRIKKALSKTKVVFTEKTNSSKPNSRITTQTFVLNHEKDYIFKKTNRMSISHLSRSS